MNELLHILLFNMFPLIGLAAAGYWLDSQFKIDIKTLTTIVFYIVLPGLIFLNVYQMPFEISSLSILAAGLVLLCLHALLAEIIARWRGYDPGKRESFRVMTMFTNCGNIGLSMITLIYSQPPFVNGYEQPYHTAAMAAITILLIMTNVLLNTLGLYLSGRGRLTPRDALRMIQHMPTVYVVLIAIAVKYFAIPVHTWFVWQIVERIAVTLPLFAMLILGIQLHRTTIYWFNPDVWLAVVTRLVIGPLLALGVIYAYGDFSPIASQVLLIFSAVPCAVNSVLFAVEFKNYPGYTTQTVMSSFIVGSVTLTAVIYLARILFPVPMW